MDLSDGASLATLIGLLVTLHAFTNRRFDRVDAKIDATRSELKPEILDTRAELTSEIDTLRVDLGSRLQTLEQRTYDLSGRLPRASA